MPTTLLFLQFRKLYQFAFEALFIHSFWYLYIWAFLFECFMTVCQTLFVKEWEQYLQHCRLEPCYANEAKRWHIVVRCPDVTSRGKLLHHEMWNEPNSSAEFWTWCHQLSWMWKVVWNLVNIPENCEIDAKTCFVDEMSQQNWFMWQIQWSFHISVIVWNLFLLFFSKSCWPYLCLPMAFMPSRTWGVWQWTH